MHSLYACGHDSQARLALGHARTALGINPLPELQEELSRASRLFIKPIQTVPHEILALIFEAANLNPVVAAQVCSSWRQIALNHRPLWRDTRFIPSVPKHSECGSEDCGGFDQACKIEGLNTPLARKHKRQIKHRCAMIDRCAMLSEDTITHLQSHGQSHMEEAIHWLGVAERSKSTLTHLDVDLTAVCGAWCSCPEGADDCLIYRTFPECGEDEAESYLHAKLLRLAKQCPNLDTVTLAFRAPSSWARGATKDIAAAESHAAFPRRVTIRTLGADGWHDGGSRNELVGFLDLLASRMEYFVFSDAGCNVLQGWAWKSINCHASRLRAFAFHGYRTVRPALFGRTPSEVEYPNLQEVVIVPPTRGRMLFGNSEDTSTIFRMPRLRSACLDARYVMQVEAPETTTLTLVIQKIPTSHGIAEVLRNFPNLRTFSIAFTEEADLHQQQEYIYQLLNALEPVKQGETLCSKLRHLGIASVHLSYDVLPNWNWIESLPKYPDRIPSSSQEAEVKELSVYEQYEMRPAVGAAIIRLEQQRRRISQGLEPLPPATENPSMASGSAFRRSVPSKRAVAQHAPTPTAPTAPQWGPCCALETIRLVGVRVELEVWQALLRSSEASVGCQPDPVKMSQLPSQDVRKSKGRRIFV